MLRQPATLIANDRRITTSEPSEHNQCLIHEACQARLISQAVRRALPLTYRKTKLLSLSVISSPSLLAQLPVEQPADVMRHRLITAATRPGQWEAWLDSVDVDHQLMEGGHRFDHLFVAMHAVRDGLGSIIAPVKLFEASFAKQELAAPLAHVAIKGVPYFVHRTPRAEGKHVTLFTNWLHRAAS